MKKSIIIKLNNETAKKFDVAFNRFEEALSYIKFCLGEEAGKDFFIFKNRKGFDSADLYLSLFSTPEPVAKIA